MDWQILITIGITLYMAGVVCLWRKQERFLLRANNIQTALLTLLIIGIVISSYDILKSPPTSENISSLLLPI